MKTQVKKTISFSNEAHAIAAGERTRNRQQLEQARDVATKRRTDIQSMDAGEARKLLYGDLLAAFIADGALTEGSAKVKASQWAAVIVALASGFVWSEGVSNIQHAYKAIAKRTPKTEKVKTADTFKGDQAHATEHMAKLSAPQRSEYAHRMLASLAEGLKDRTQANTALAAALEFTLRNPQAVLELMKAETTFKAARKAA